MWACPETPNNSVATSLQGRQKKCAPNLTIIRGQLVKFLTQLLHLFNTKKRSAQKGPNRGAYKIGKKTPQT